MKDSSIEGILEVKLISHWRSASIKWCLYTSIPLQAVFWLKSPIFILQRAYIPKNGVEFCQQSNGDNRRDVGTSYDLARRCVKTETNWHTYWHTDKVIHRARVPTVALAKKTKSHNCLFWTVILLQQDIGKTTFAKLFIIWRLFMKLTFKLLPL